MGSKELSRSSGTRSLGNFLFRACLHASKLLIAHFVLFPVLAGVIPLERAVSCSSLTNAENRVELVTEVELDREQLGHDSGSDAEKQMELVTEVELDGCGTGTRARLGCGSGSGVCSGARTRAISVA